MIWGREEPDLAESDTMIELERHLTSSLLRVVEQTALAAVRFKGFGDEVDADEAAVEAMHNVLSSLPISGRIVIGEDADGGTSRLYVGEEIGQGSGPVFDIAVDPLEGTTQCAKARPGALSAIAIAGENCILKVPAVYMDKIAIGPGYPDGIVDLDATPAENLRALADARDCRVSELTVCILDRPRHGRLIEEVRDAGAAIHLIGDGDIAGVFKTTDPDKSGVDIYLGIGGAPEGVLGAATIKCRGGQMQGRLKILKEEHKARLDASSIEDVDRKYGLDDLVNGDVIFAATGVTDSWMLGGVQFNGSIVSARSVIMKSRNGNIRWVVMQENIGQAVS